VLVLVLGLSLGDSYCSVLSLLCPVLSCLVLSYLAFVFNFVISTILADAICFFVCTLVLQQHSQTVRPVSRSTCLCLCLHLFLSHACICALCPHKFRCSNKMLVKSLIVAALVAAPVSGVCNKDWCTSGSTSTGALPDGYTYDCIAGNQGERCTCSQGSARSTNTTVKVPAGDGVGNEWIYYEYTCCDDDDQPNMGESCGIVSCSPEYCTSPSTDAGGKDCRAVSPSEDCTCSEGRVAGLTGRASVYMQTTTYEYTCCPAALGSFSGVELVGTKCVGPSLAEPIKPVAPPVTDGVCNKDWCSSNVNGIPCIAGNMGVACSCSRGRARSTGTVKQPAGIGQELIFYEYTCCENDDEPNVGESCGINSCSQEYCTSPGVDGGKDCFSIPSEGCTCSEGRVAGLTGRTAEYKKKTFKEYTCCPAALDELSGVELVGTDCSNTSSDLSRNGLKAAIVAAGVFLTIAVAL
jgi:hypothetical protein